jgi:ligand-binding sensor domain-containing protein
MRNFFWRFLILILAVLGSCSTVPEDAIEPNRKDSFTYFNTGDGLIDYEVYSLFEDSQGNIWVGTYLGVSKFNGSSFESYDWSNDGIIYGSIVAIGEDYDGNIWIASSNGYSVLEDNTWETTEGIPITSYYLDKDNNFWVGTDGYGAVQLYAGGGQVYTQSECIDCDYVTSFFEDNTGTLWYTSLGGAIKVTDKINQSTERIATLEGTAFTRGVQDAWGNLIFGTYYEESIYRYSNNSFSPINLPVDYTVVNGFEFFQKKIYMVTEQGFLVYDGATIQEVKTPQGDYLFTSMIQDANGYIWLGTSDNGIIRFNPKFEF